MGSGKMHPVLMVVLVIIVILILIAVFRGHVHHHFHHNVLDELDEELHLNKFHDRENGRLMWWVVAVVVVIVVVWGANAARKGKWMEHQGGMWGKGHMGAKSGGASASASLL